VNDIALVDYGAGNLTSVKKALRAIDAHVFVPREPAELDGVRGIIVPGVGHFDATRRLAGAWTDAIREAVQGGRPLLGICVGMQWLFEGSDEAPDCPGLGAMAGRCSRLSGHQGAVRLKVPHVGWNALTLCRDTPIVRGVRDGAQVYFTHSYAAPVSEDTVATTTHGETFASIVQRGDVAGVQFHPEKSGDVGLHILQNFIRSVS
jgi:glutamine amidotransferase